MALINSEIKKKLYMNKPEKNVTVQNLNERYYINFIRILQWLFN